MIRETLAALIPEVQRAKTALGLSQNKLARAAGIHPSVLSRMLGGTLTSEPGEQKLAAWLKRVRRQVVAAERKAKARHHQGGEAA